MNMSTIESDLLQVVPGHLNLCITSAIMHSLHRKTDFCEAFSLDSSFISLSLELYL